MFPSTTARLRRTVRAAVLAAVLGAGCAGGQDRADRPLPGSDERADAGRLRAPLPTWRPGNRLLSPGLHELRVGAGRPALLHVPDTGAPARPRPLMVMLHGAGSSPRSGLRVVRDAVRGTRVAVLAPASRDRTWDVIVGGFGPDVAVLAALLRRVSAGMPVDRSRMAIAGHSDGASYALSLGLTNGDLFTHVIAFSPGFAVPGARRGRPPIYESHGVEDKVLPIDQTSRRLVPALRRAGHAVRFREFPGGHGVPARIARGAIRWFLDR